MLGRFSRHLRRCWWRYSGHYVSNVAIAENAAFDVCRYMYPESCDDDKGQHNRYFFSIVDFAEIPAPDLLSSSSLPSPLSLTSVLYTHSLPHLYLVPRKRLQGGR